MTTTLAPEFYHHQNLRRQSPSTLLHYQPSSQLADPSTLSSSSSPSYTNNIDIYNSSPHSQQPHSSLSSGTQSYQSVPFHSTTNHNFNNLSINVPTPMQSAQPSGSWNFAVSNGQLTPTSARTPRNSHHYHQRESSLSSIGSAGPSSPYNPSTSNPHIILPDNSDAYYDGLPSAEVYHNFSKPLTPHTSSNDFIYGYNEFNSASNLAAFMALQKQQEDTESMPAPDYSHSRGSVAGSHDSPSTPLESAPMEFRNVPKLDRTMSDVYNDELYSPNFAFTSAPTTKSSTTTALPQSDVFSQTLQKANSQHLSAPSHSPLSNNPRRTSPFRQGSPLAPSSDGFGGQIRLASAQQMREQQKAESDARALAQQIKRSSPQSQSEQNTISPKDALLDYNETDEASSMPLFPATSPRYTNQNVRTLKTEPSAASDLDDSASQQSFGSMATSRRDSSTYSGSQPTSGFTFAPSSVPGGIQVPQQYPFVPQPRREPSNISAATPDFPSTLTSMESSSSDYTPDIKKPSSTLADSGTYTCTYHGCTLRFETPQKLQKHKREGHRQSVGHSGSPESGMTSAVNRNSQAGPHKCERINPSTGKPCNTLFSRPYDLTRHEFSIHNSKKEKFRCNLCSEDKLFSRMDALTRHRRVCHDLEPTRKGK